MTVIMEVYIDAESYEQIADMFVKYFYVTSFVMTGTSLILALCIVRISLRGTVINAYPRRHMPVFLAVKVSMKCTAVVSCISQGACD